MTAPLLKSQGPSVESLNGEPRGPGVGAEMTG